MNSDLLLVLGILLSTVSQLRPDGAPIGPGEVCLMIWIALMIGRETVKRGPQFTPALSRLVIFWMLFAVAQSIGTLAGFAIGDVHDSSLFMHDVMAYPLLAAISMLCVVGPSAESRLHRVSWFLVTIGSAALALQLAQRLDGLTTLLCGLTIFSIFHLIVRHPIFWFAIAMCLVAAEDRKASLRRRWS